MCVVSSVTGGLNNATGLSGTAGDVSTMFFGTVSGGLSSELTGGNFWQGAATGLAVSGLNHVAHKMTFKSLLSKIENDLVDAGYKIDGTIPLENRVNYALEMIDKLPSLKSNLKLVHKFKSSISIRYHNIKKLNEYGGEISAEASMLGVDLYRGAFTTNLSLAVALGHELIHVYHHVSGLYSQWINIGGLAYAHHMSEANAYIWNYHAYGSWYGFGMGKVFEQFDNAAKTYAPR